MKAFSLSPHPGSQVPWKQRPSAWTANNWPAMGSLPGPVQLWPPWFGWFKTLVWKWFSLWFLQPLLCCGYSKTKAILGLIFFFRWNPFILPQSPITCLGCFVCPQCPKVPWNGLFSLTFGHLFNVEMHVLCFWIDVSFASWVIYPLHALSFSPRLEYPLAAYWTPACWYPHFHIFSPLWSITWPLCSIFLWPVLNPIFPAFCWVV